jgi:zinc transport system ATP-binding protein
MKKEPLISIADLTVSYDHEPVFEHVNLTIYRGDQIALIGANGSGKTTLLKTILGLKKQDEGTLTITPSLRIGYLPQVLQIADRFFPMSVEEVILQGRRSRKRFLSWLTAQDRRFLNELVGPFHAQELLKKRFGYLSMGQKQLVLFLRMLAQEPDLVFLDEPTSSLDVARKDSLYAMLEILKKNKVAYVIITHDLPSFDKIIDRVVLIEHSILFDGDHRAFCEHPEFSPFIHTHHGVHHEHS